MGGLLEVGAFLLGLVEALLEGLAVAGFELDQLVYAVADLSFEFGAAAGLVFGEVGGADDSGLQLLFCFLAGADFSPVGSDDGSAFLLGELLPLLVEREKFGMGIHETVFHFMRQPTWEPLGLARQVDPGAFGPRLPVTR